LDTSLGCITVDFALCLLPSAPSLPQEGAEGKEKGDHRCKKEGKKRCEASDTQPRVGWRQQPWDGPVTTDSKDEARVFIAAASFGDAYKAVCGLPLTIKLAFEVNPGNTLAHLSPKTARTTETIELIVSLQRPIHPEWVTGFIDGEGCFSISFSKRSHLRVGIEAKPSLAVGQNLSSRPVMEEVCRYFESPLTQLWIDKQIVKYETRSLKHLREVVIPHFEKHPLRSYKAEDFFKFREVVELMTKGRHLHKDGMREILSLEYAINLDPAASSRRRRPLGDWLALLESNHAFLGMMPVL
jgi:hypothetical protein